MKWGEWHRHGDVALGYYWPSDWRRIICFRWSCVIKPWWCRLLDVRSRWCQWLGQDWSGKHKFSSHYSKRHTIWIVYFWEFPFSIFRPQLTTATETMESKTAEGRGLLYSFLSRNISVINGGVPLRDSNSLFIFS